jgi:hypothetical protein
MGWLRGAVGIALLAAPGVPMRLARRSEPTAAEMLLMRTIGIRDLALGLGTGAAARSGDEGDIRRWLAAGGVPARLRRATCFAWWRADFGRVGVSAS